MDSVLLFQGFGSLTALGWHVALANLGVFAFWLASSLIEARLLRRDFRETARQDAASYLPLCLLLCALLAYALAILTAAVRDTAQVVTFMLSLGIFISPVLFPLSQFPAAWRWVLWLNPMTAPVLGYQSMLLQGQWPPLMVWLVLGAWLVAVAALLNVLLARSREHLVDWL